jgi:type III secretion protein J
MYFAMRGSMPSKKIAGYLLVAALALLQDCKVDLYNKLGEPEANEVLAALVAAGIDATKISPDDKSWSIQVDKNHLGNALEVLRSQGLPRERHANMGDIFKKQGLVSTPSEERIRYIYALSQELSDTLTQIDGVLVARVHVVIPANDPLSDKVKPSSASIFIKHRADANLQAVAPAVKNLVMRGIEGLSYDNISLSFFTAERGPAIEAAQPAPLSGMSAQTFASALPTLGLGALGLLAVAAAALVGYRMLSRNGLRAKATKALARVQAKPTPTNG